MPIERARWIALVSVVGVVLLGYAAYWLFLVPPLQVAANGLYTERRDLGGGRMQADYEMGFLVVVVKANHWPGPLASQDFELTGDSSPTAVKCAAMEMLSEDNSFPSNCCFWAMADESHDVTLVQKRKYSHIVFRVKETVGRATINYRGQRVGTFVVDRHPLDKLK